MSGFLERKQSLSLNLIINLRKSWKAVVDYHFLGGVAPFQIHRKNGVYKLGIFAYSSMASLYGFLYYVGARKRCRSTLAVAEFTP